jgi:hypothetical protein
MSNRIVEEKPILLPEKQKKETRPQGQKQQCKIPKQDRLERQMLGLTQPKRIR